MSEILARSHNGLHWFGGNETRTDAKDADASASRLGSRHIPGQSGGGGKRSFDVFFQFDHEPTDEELLVAKRIEAAVIVGGFNGTGGEIGICIWNGRDQNDIEDADQIKVVEMRHNEVEFKVPIIAPNLQGVNGAVGPVTRMWAPDGLHFTQQQMDGNFVTYRTKVAWSIDPLDVKAIWSAWTGRLE